MNSVARGQHLHHGASFGIGGFNLGHGLMEIMVEFLAHRVDARNAVALEHAQQFFQRHLHAGGEVAHRRLALAQLWRNRVGRALQVLQHIHQVAREAGNGVFVHVGQLALAAAAGVFRFRHGAQGLVFHRGQLAFFLVEQGLQRTGHSLGCGFGGLIFGEVFFVVLGQCITHARYIGDAPIKFQAFLKRCFVYARRTFTDWSPMPRSFNRSNAELRPIRLTPGASRHAEGSCLVEFGHTKVLCTASVDEGVPHFLRNTGRGWVTAEYGMLPRATNSRNPREAARGKQSGRTQEIQRLIGRALRTSVDLEKLGERQIIIDCDVIEADGGTRTASITGGFVALALALRTLQQKGLLKRDPLIVPVAAISCGIVGGEALLDLDYEEDSSAEVDANVIMTADGQMVEMQASGEEATFSEAQLVQLLAHGKEGIAQLVKKQREALGFAA